MPEPEAWLALLTTFAWAWRAGSGIYAAYWVSRKIGADRLGDRCKHVLAAAQILSTFTLNLIPLSKFPRISLFNRVLSIPSQAYTLYYANAYIAPLLDSQRITIFFYIVTILSVLETAYKIRADWSRIE